MSRASSRSYQTPSKRAIFYSFVVVVLWWILMATGMRLPYFHTHLAFQLRAFMLFPLFVGLLGYFAFFFTGKLSSTGYKLRMSQLATKRERVKNTLWGVFGLVLISAGVAWTSIGFAAWVTDLVAKKEYVHQYVIERVEVRGGPIWSTMYHLHLQGQGASKGVTLPLKKVVYEQSRWKSGQSICVRGRSWMLGTIIDDVSQGTESCVGQPFAHQDGSSG